MSETPIADTFVYVIAFGQRPTFTGPVKIGVSSNPEKRLASLQTASPHQIGLVAKVLFPSREIALQMEECFHHMQRAHRMRGEWFDMPPHKSVDLLRLYLRWAIDLLTDLSREEQAVAVKMAEAHL